MSIRLAAQIASLVPDSRIFSLGFPSRKKYEEALSKSKNLRDREMMAVDRGFETQYTRKDLPTPRIRNAEEDIGSAVIGVPSDRSDVARVEMIEGLLVPEGRNIQGGQGFAREYSEWASGKGIAERFQRKIDQVAEKTGLPVQAVVNVMSNRAIDFSDPPALIMAQMAQEIPMTKTIKESLNKAVRTKFPDFAGFDSAEGIAQLAGEVPVSTYNRKGEVVTGSAGELRKWFIDRSELAPYRDAGMPSFNQINEVITDPELKDLNYGDAGSTIFTPDIGAPVLPSGEKHSTYSHTFGSGSDVSGYEIPIPFELNAPESNRILSEQLSKAGQPLTRNQKIDAFNKRGADNVGSYEIATQKRADDINAYIDFVQRGKPLPKELKAGLVAAGVLSASQANAGVITDEMIDEVSATPMEGVVARTFRDAPRSTGSITPMPSGLLNRGLAATAQGVRAFNQAADQTPVGLLNPIPPSLPQVLENAAYGSSDTVPEIRDDVLRAIGLL